MRILLFLLFLPVIAALVIDVTINFFPDAQFIQPYNIALYKDTFFHFADAGWVVEKFAPGTIEMLKSIYSADAWQTYVDPILALPNVLVSSIPFLIVLAIYAIYQLCTNGLYLQSFSFGKKQEKTVYKHTKSNAMKFKRK